MPHVCDGVGPQCTQGVIGPDGVAGMLLSVSESVAPAGMAADLRYKPDAQTWRAGPAVADGKPKYHVGFWNDRRPSAESLLRQKPLRGTPVTLRDGAQWTVAIAMATVDAHTLPTVMDLDDADKWVGRISPAYAYLCDQAKTAYDMLMSGFMGTANSFPLDELMRIVVAALGASYRVGAVEIAALGLVADGHILEVIESVCDWRKFHAGVMRKMGESPAVNLSGTDSGGTAETLLTP